ncbi:methyl-accepting chemotaxis protein [Pseudoalteromonas sp. S16_S37]|uniref:methyl-accepting chemotaxis protein n=1 Tax=Pseudoalteromonas sp. S16_S37 TaxID=2720228 RepID=UPI00168016E8|nr:HAMP domain-containing methyl-accepting chemotaxis protein [Pseudoalteromonas sp. S16_S37]MBD1584593.1 methyl-accepting chemotaxis protein [Pseudoalteromonas sp. S16_S37]
MALLENFTIKRRLQLNALVVGVALIVMLVVIIYEAKTMLQLNNAIQYSKELNIHQLTMRKHEKNFLFYKQPESLKQFDSEYNRLQDTLVQLRKTFDDFDIDSDRLDEFAGLASQYNSDFQNVVELQKEIGLHPKDALYGELRAAVHEVETLLKERENYELLAMMLQLRRAEKDFMLRLDTKYQSKLSELISKFSTQIKSAGFPAGYESELLSLLMEYQSKFNDLVNAQVKLGLNLEDGALGEMKSSVERSEELVAKVVEATRQEISKSSDNVQFIAFAVFAFAAVTVMVLVLSTSNSIVRPVERVYLTIERIRKENNLGLQIEQSGNDEITIMTRDFNSLINDFKILISEVNSALHTINDATTHLTESTAQTSAGVSEQLHEADMVATAATEMQATIQDIAHNTEAASQKAESTNGNAQQGRAEVDATIKHIIALSESLSGASDVVSQLEKDGETIGSVLDVIRGIAEQTNLLALNAAIEAARAGEQGRGFAVVADEVRSLAQRTQDSTQEIESIISTLQQRTREVVNIMQQCREQGGESVSQAEKAGELLSMITEDVQTIMDMSTHIATAIDEQSQVASEVNKNVVRIRDIAQVASDHASANAQSSEEVAEQAKVLRDAVAKYKV